LTLLALPATFAAAGLLAFILTARRLLATLLPATFAAAGLLTTATRLTFALTARRLLATLLTATLILLSIVCHFYPSLDSKSLNAYVGVS
jgi:hypothetical protein